MTRYYVTLQTAMLGGLEDEWVGPLPPLKPPAHFQWPAILQAQGTQDEPLAQSPYTCHWPN